MKRTLQSLIQERADKILNDKLPLEWIKRDQNDQNDLGIDFEVEITNPLEGDASYISTGILFKIQNKGHQSVTKLKNGKISQQLSVENVKYLFEQINVPVILTVTDIDKGNVYWHSIQLDDNIQDSLIKAQEKNAKSIQIYIEASNILNTYSIKSIEKAIVNSQVIISIKSTTNKPKHFDPGLFDTNTRQMLREQLFRIELDGIIKETKETRNITLQNIYHNSENIHYKYLALNHLYFDQYDPEKHNVEEFQNYLQEFRDLSKKIGRYHFIDYLARVKFKDILINLKKFERLNDFSVFSEYLKRDTKGNFILSEPVRTVSNIINDIKQIHRGSKLFGIENICYLFSVYLPMIDHEIFYFLYSWRYMKIAPVLRAFYQKIKEIYLPLWSMGLINYKFMKREKGIQEIVTAINIDYFINKWIIQLADPQKIDKKVEFNKNMERCTNMFKQITDTPEEFNILKSTLINRIVETEERIKLIEIEFDNRLNK